ncbi:Signal recognition particle receptor FtsY [Streptococcus canis]|uniref:Signal recognition particle receptor FtsY n=1 Tax=Streptococcus canis TaxID=1329 RepID=A0A3P5XQ64_STRCB|nr:signal recognition particle-docking protein FtsY [Streptococcus canis]MDV5973011.1 signal recognition particle-docking protein FtsY [Streptococcus canis]QKG77173.1 signal recognition particle-docking protein FtsY [Streptococcus canis]VDC42625.1 Signal recognition particle receptor FtsY [Streptococcus canis]
MGLFDRLFGKKETSKVVEDKVEKDRLEKPVGEDGLSEKTNEQDKIEMVQQEAVSWEDVGSVENDFKTASVDAHVEEETVDSSDTSLVDADEKEELNISELSQMDASESKDVRDQPVVEQFPMTPAQDDASNDSTKETAADTSEEQSSSQHVMEDYYRRKAVLEQNLQEAAATVPLMPEEVSQEKQEFAPAEVSQDKASQVTTPETEQEKYNRSLKKTRTGLSARLNSFFANFRRVDEEFFEDLEEMLILSDVGVHVATALTEELRYEAKLENAKKPDALKRVIVEKLVDIYEKDGCYNEAINYQDGLTVMLFVGVNGVGKTTSIGKLAYRYKQEGKKVMLVAADTFRAGAVAQLVEWGRRVDVPVITGPEKADPASVVFDGVEKAVAEGADILLIDTAGRLQNKENLMAELEKMGRIIKRVLPDAPHETLLALDASTGQNALSQAKEFSKITPLTGLILTKIDGTAKGGVVLAIRQELDIPVKFIGFGEKIDDIGEFHSEDFMRGLLEGII